MTLKFTPYIYILFFLILSHGVFAQKITLKISSKDSVENAVLKKVSYKKSFESSALLKKEIALIYEALKNKGYFTSTVDDIVKNNNVHTYFFSLGKRIKQAIIKIDSAKKSISIENLQGYLKSISKELELKGQSFSTITLKNITIKKDTLYGEVKTLNSRKRYIDKVIIKGYNKFSKSYLNHFLNLNRKTLFNKETLKSISQRLQSLNFISEIKSPEVLFTKDSTLLYIYLKKKNNSSFDGLVNFSSKENSSGLLFNGHLDLKLNNILHTGEKFNLFWKAIGEERQEFNISTEIPYIFNSKFTTIAAFNIYKNDSTFLNTAFKSSIIYSISSKVDVGFSYVSEKSEDLLENSNQINNFNTNFIGLYFTYNSKGDSFFKTPKFSFELNTSIGQRKTSVNTNQTKLTLTAQYIKNINKRNHLYFRNQTGYLKSSNFFQNELFRIGGFNSIRGFNEQSIFTSKFSFLNIEYRLLTDNSSYLYSISDIGLTDTNTLGSFGLGYSYTNSNSTINLAYVVGKKNNASINFNKSQILIKILTFF